MELEKLAKEAIEKPDLLSKDLVDWLLCPSAQRAFSFFFSLGLQDRDGAFLSSIEEIGRLPEGAWAFGAYWGGWAKRDQAAAEARLDSLAIGNEITGQAVVRASSYLGAGLRGVRRVIEQIEARRVDPPYAAPVMRGWVDGLSEDEFLLLLKSVARPDFEHGASALGLLGWWACRKRPVRGDLAAFAWECLARDPILKTPQDAWHLDQLAAKLAEQDPERGFALLKTLLKQPASDRNRWEPFGLHSTNAFWKVLLGQDKGRSLRTALDACLDNPLARFRISWRLRELLDQEADREVLLSLAAEDIGQARIIAGWLTSGKPGFWPLAFQLHEKYPDDERLHVELLAGIQQMGSVVVGPLHAFYQTRKDQVEEKLADPKTPSSVRGWLKEVRDRLTQEIESYVVWEYDQDINELRRHIQDKESDQRIWAIGRVLKYGRLEDIRRLLTVDDIEEVLPQVDLPEQRRKMFERAVMVWRRGK